MKKTNNNKIIPFIFSYFLIFFYAIAFNNATGWVVLVFISLVYLLEILTMLSPLRWIKVEIDETIYAQVGDCLPIKIKINGIGRLPMYYPHFSIELQDDSYKEISNYIGQERELFLQLTMKKRGLIKQQSLQISSRDLFGWFEKKYQLNASVDWIVLPEINPTSDLLISKVDAILSQNHDSDNSFDIKGYREYQAGDSLNRVDWKASSRLQKIIVRDYEKFISPKWRFIFYGVASSNFEAMLSLYYSLYQSKYKVIEFTLIGEGVDDDIIDSVAEFALIQPLNNLVEVAIEKNEFVCIFVPEAVEELNDNIQGLGAKNVHMIAYEQLVRD